jgi:hypothetical protein
MEELGMYAMFELTRITPKKPISGHIITANSRSNSASRSESESEGKRSAGHDNEHREDGDVSSELDPDSVNDAAGGVGFLSID